jgi:hypothetical protein
MSDTTTHLGLPFTTLGDPANIEDVAKPLAEKLDTMRDEAPANACFRTLGTGEHQACAGNDVRLSDQRVPIDGSVSGTKLGTATVRQETATPQSFLSWGCVASGGTVLDPGTNDWTVESGLGSGKYNIRLTKAKSTTKYAILITPREVLLGESLVANAHPVVTAEKEAIAVQIENLKKETVNAPFSFLILAAS